MLDFLLTFVQIVFVLIILFFSLKWWFKRESRLKRQNLQIKWNSAYGKDVVVLHQFPRARFCPSPSPYPLKLETFLRLHKIKYVNDFDEPMSDKNKSPWITINGVNIADSQLIIDYLTQHFKLQINPGLDQNALAISRAFRLLIEQDLYWALAHDRWVTHRGSYVTKYFAPLFPKIPFLEDFLITKIYYKMIRDQTYAQGMGRHSEKEIEKMVKHKYANKKTIRIFIFSPFAGIRRFGELVHLSRH